MNKKKPQLSFWQIWNMCFGFLGIQFGFALQNANVSRIFQTLGASIDDIPILWIAAPITGLVVQPIIGYLSDNTWGRLGRRRPYFLYGDGVGNINIRNLIAFHESHGKLATLTAVHPPARFGYLDIANGLVRKFGEKNQSDAGWINGGFFVVEPEVSSLVKSHDEPFETGALPRLVSGENLMSFHHDGFWQPMDTLREKEDLSKLARLSTPPWLNGI